MFKQWRAIAGKLMHPLAVWLLGVLLVTPAAMHSTLRSRTVGRDVGAYGGAFEGRPDADARNRLGNSPRSGGCVG